MLSKFTSQRSVVSSGMRTFATISNIKAREILDSRGNPTIEADVITSDGRLYRAAVPSGASTGIYEALELRDKDASRYLGKGVQKAVANVHNILSPALKGQDVTQQTKIDKEIVEELDGTQNEWGWCKQKVGANAILAVSLAVARAGADAKNVPLYQHLAELTGKPTNKYVTPVPSLNIINGGAHAGNSLEIQEFMILPTGAHSFSEAMRLGAETYHSLAKLVKQKYGKSAANVGDEGGFGAPQIKDENETLELIMEAIQKAGHSGKIDIGLDVAASEFFDSKTGNYNLSQKLGKTDRIMTPDQLTDLYANLASKYPIKSIEDPFDQDDFAAYAKMTARIGDKVQIVGDDLLVTNPKRV